MERAQTMPTESPAAPGNPPASIVRPADIYKRMREEQKVRQPGLVDPSANEHTLGTDASVVSPPTSCVPLRFSGNTPAGPVHATEQAHQVETGGVDGSIPPVTQSNEAPALSLPDVKRLSTFNPQFFAESSSNAQTIHDPSGQPLQLQHNPSLGFRSAVNQAFDVPETPSTIADSVARSNSDSTAGISPIIPRRDTTDDKTPTILEDPNENTATPTESDLVFKPGHRRDLSLPSSGDSPSRRPIITGPDTSVSSDLGQLSVGTPAESPWDTPSSSQQHSSNPNPVQPSQETSERDLPAPLSVQTNVAAGPSTTTDPVPVIIPSMSTENSPEDTENDRLRKEIIRSLSRENTPSDQQDQTPPQTSGQDTLIPREYENYWGGQQATAPSDHQPSASTFISSPAASEIPSIEPPAPISSDGPRPKLKKRFSWEESSDDEESTTPVTQAQPSRPPPMPGQYPFSQDSVHPESVLAPPTSQLSDTVEHVGGRDKPAPEKPKLTVVPPSLTDTVSIRSSDHAPESVQAVQSHTIETLTRAEGQSFSPSQSFSEAPAHIPSTSIESGLLGFKEILGIQSSDERVQAFNRTRDQFATIDTGLNHWVQVTVQAHPEHSDVVERNSKPLSDDFKNSVPRAKFPKLASLGNLASSLQDGSHSTSGHIRRPSAHLGTVKQHQVGKDFLHKTGVLGVGKSTDKAVVSSAQQAPAIPVLLTVILVCPVGMRTLTATMWITWALSHAMSNEDDNHAITFIDIHEGQGQPSPRLHSPILHDIPARGGFQGRLPSVSSLGVQDIDLGPPAPLAQKLAQFEAIQTSSARHNGRPSSTPRLLSPLSPQHDWSRRPEQRSSSRDPASYRISSSPMEKLKNVSRFRRISRETNQSDFMAGQPPKKPFDKLTGLFSRTQQRKSGPPEEVESSSENSTGQYLAPVTSRSGSRIASSSISSVDNHERPVSLPDGRNTLHGRRAPPEGYFAHESPESFSVAQPYQHIRGSASSDRMRLSDPTQIDPRRLSPHSTPYYSPAPPQRQPHVTSARYSSPLPSPVPRTPPSRGRSEDHTYAQDLHFRSRSPKAFAPRPEERNLPKHDPTDPAYILGTFRSSNPRTSRIGDQELPWKITIPGDADEVTANTSASWRRETEGVLNGTRLPTYQEDVKEHGTLQRTPAEKRAPPFPHPTTVSIEPNPSQINPTSPEHPHRSGARAINTLQTPVELPVRTDDNSSEEIMMSSTAYPGQEWRPLGFSEWEHQ
ncbi:hypothetical protein BDV12DRAFT_182331 [Aspergillus spectabilis]